MLRPRVSGLPSSCLIPRFDGAILSLEWKDALWDTSRERPEHARRQSSDTAVASVARAAGSGTGHRSRDGVEVARARRLRMKTGPADPRSTVLTGTGDGSRSGAARARHWTTAFIGAFGAMASRTCRMKATDLRAVSHTRLSHRCRRGADSGGQAPPFRRH